MDNSTEKISITALINQTGMFDNELANNANISITTLSNIKAGRKVRERLIWRLVHKLNEILGTSYKITDITGIKY